MEALLAISILAVAGGAIMLALTSSVQTTSASYDSAVALGIAEQVIDEVVGRRYAAAGAGHRQTVLTANSWELSGQGRERFDDTDDYNRFAAVPVEGVWGLPLGLGDGAGSLRHSNFRLPATQFDGWREEIEVYYVDETDHSVRLTGNNTSDFRAVEVRILRAGDGGTFGELARLRRVYAYVPPPQ